MTSTVRVRLPAEIAPPSQTRLLSFPAIKYDRNQFLATGLQTGHAVWPCSALLCDYMMDHPDVVEGKRVLELGCGLGVCGSVASVLGAQHVVLSDGDDSVIDKARDAAKANGLELQSLEFRVIRWGEPGSLIDGEGERFEVIIGSDLLYGPPRGALRPDGKDQRIKDLLELVDRRLEMTATATFFLAFERRDVSHDEIMETARDFKLSCNVPEGEYCEDIFANRTDDMTDFWRACLFEFRRIVT